MYNLIFCFPLLISLEITMCIAQTNPEELITVFNNFKKAAATGKESEIARYMSPRFLNDHKNNVASIGNDFTPDMVKIFTDHYDISQCKLIKTIENGPTIGLVFDRPLEKDESDQNQINFLILKFVKYDIWKYDIGYSTYKSKLDEKGNPIVFKESFLPEKVAIDGKIPKTPALLPKVEIRANYFIMGTGYKIELSINGNEPIVSDEGSSSGVLPAGIKNGINQLELTITKIPAKYESYPDVKIYYLSKNNEEKTAFSLNRDEKKTGTIKTTFEVN